MPPPTNWMRSIMTDSWSAAGDRGQWLDSLRSAIDKLAEAEWPRIRPYSEDNLPERSWGPFLRHLLDKDATFHALITLPHALSVARAMMGRGTRAGLARAHNLCRGGTSGHTLAPASSCRLRTSTTVVFATACHRLPDYLDD